MLEHHCVRDVVFSTLTRSGVRRCNVSLRCFFQTHFTHHILFTHSLLRIQTTNQPTDQPSIHPSVQPNKCFYLCNVLTCETWLIEFINQNTHYSFESRNLFSVFLHAYAHGIQLEPFVHMFRTFEGIKTNPNYRFNFT